MKIFKEEKSKHMITTTKRHKQNTDSPEAVRTDMRSEKDQTDVKYICCIKEMAAISMRIQRRARFNSNKSGSSG